MQNITAACCLISIVLQGGLHIQHRCRHIGLNICKIYNVPLLRHWDFSEYETALLWLVFILNIPQPGTHQTVMHLTSLEFHHREDLPQPPSLVATLLTLDFWLDGSIIIPFACRRRHWICLSMSESWRYIKYVRSCGLSVLNNRRNVYDVLIFSFQRAMPVLWKKETGERELTPSPVSSLRG